MPAHPFALPFYLGEASPTLILLSRDNRFIVHLSPYANKLQKMHPRNLSCNLSAYTHIFFPLSPGVGLSEFQRDKVAKRVL